MLVDERFQANLNLSLQHFWYVDIHFPLLKNQSISQTPLDAQRLIFTFTHIAFKWQTGVRLFEQVSGWTRGPAESTLIVFLAIDDVFIPAGTFSDRLFTGINRHVDVTQRLTRHPDTRSLRIITAIFRRSVK
jgi:hypothetical protein